MSLRDPFLMAFALSKMEHCILTCAVDVPIFEIPCVFAVPYVIGQYWQSYIVGSFIVFVQKPHFPSLKFATNICVSYLTPYLRVKKY